VEFDSFLKRDNKHHIPVKFQTSYNIHEMNLLQEVGGMNSMTAEFFLLKACLSLCPTKVIHSSAASEDSCSKEVESHFEGWLFDSFTAAVTSSLHFSQRTLSPSPICRQQQLNLLKLIRFLYLGNV